MGKIDEEDRPFMIVDNDTGRIFDTRIDRHVEKVTASMSVSTYQSANKLLEKDDLIKKNDSDKAVKKDLRKSMRVSAWGDWWEEKKEINLNYIRAAEAGNLADVNKYLDNDLMLGKGADVNFKGLHDWTALHYAAENERVEIAKLLLK